MVLAKGLKGLVSRAVYKPTRTHSLWKWSIRKEWSRDKGPGVAVI